MDKVSTILQEVEDKLKGIFDILEIKDINYGRQFKIGIKNGEYIFRVFFNKKGDIKYDYSQIKDEKEKIKLKAILEQTGFDNESKNLNIVEETHSKIINFKPIIGTDESGKGDYFGPLVTAGVYVDTRTKSILDSSGIKDSKKIRDKKIIELALIIKNVCRGQYAVIEITPNTYNNLYFKFKSEGKNLNTLLAWSHAKAIEEVLTKVNCDDAVSDKFADERYILSKLQEKGRGINLVQEHKAESYTAVAAASILARARFLERMKKMSIEYDIEFGKGASERIVEQAKDFIKKYGKEKLASVAKLHFKTTNQL
ncbi:ribonuclease HIII [Saccharicrinis sp. FJH2]|uniref:ribonuclease HIII n=1 Tax=Saccharicrinis sp. FJH65 TaxID=3344659 RepID=UPI0035F43058